MLVWFDTEFIDAGDVLVPLSLGAVRADGAEFYAELAVDTSLADDWVRANILPTLRAEKETPAAVAYRFRAFCGEEPEFWAHYAAYDWVVLCKLYGGLMRLPAGWPSYVRDTRCLMDDKAHWFSDEHADQHNALADARWVRDAWVKLRAL